MQYHWIPEALRPYDVIFSFDDATEPATVSEKLMLWIKSRMSRRSGIKQKTIYNSQTNQILFAIPVT